MGREKYVAINDTVNLIDDNIEIRNCSSSYICKELNQKDHELAVMKKALELACKQSWLRSIWEIEEEESVRNDYNHFVKAAEEELKGDQTRTLNS